MISLKVTIIRLIIAFLLGGIIGLEREKKGRSAGLRTHILVSLGSTLVMLVAIYLFETYKNVVALDPGRIAVGVVTGIGFLGAGTIIRNPEKSTGLTTAASIWVSAVIGLAVGCGYFSVAIIATILVVLTLFLLKRTEKVIS